MFKGDNVFNRVVPPMPDINTIITILTTVFGALWGAIKLLVNPIKKDVEEIKGSLDKLTEDQREIGVKVVKNEHKIESTNQYLDAVNVNLKEQTRTLQRSYNEFSEMKGLIKGLEDIRKRGE